MVSKLGYFTVLLLTVLIGSSLCVPARKITRSTTEKPRVTTPAYFTRSMQIANEKCKVYMEERYKRTTVGPVVLGDPPTIKKEQTCRKLEPLVVGGKKAKDKEFPHMALVGFDSINGVEWGCGGSLISDRFILSAAHCSKEQKPKWIRLGELDLSKTTDDPQGLPIDYKIIEEFPHPNFKPPDYYNDIILYKTNTIIKFNPYIRPICLYVSSVQHQEEMSAVVTGWGTTGTNEGTSNSLLKVTINTLNTKHCNKVYRKGTSKFSKGFNATTAICAGDLKNAKDTCTGDSGGPLQIPLKNETCMYTQIGITSVGSRDCGDMTPAVYTNVLFYIDWIQAIVWPEDA